MNSNESRDTAHSSDQTKHPFTLSNPYPIRKQILYYNNKIKRVRNDVVWLTRALIAQSHTNWSTTMKRVPDPFIEQPNETFFLFSLCQDPTHFLMGRKRLRTDKARSDLGVCRNAILASAERRSFGKIQKNVYLYETSKDWPVRIEFFYLFVSGYLNRIISGFVCGFCFITVWIDGNE